MCIGYFINTQAADNSNVLEGVVIVVHKKLSSRKGMFMLHVHAVRHNVPAKYSRFLSSISKPNFWKKLVHGFYIYYQ